MFVRSVFLLRGFSFFPFIPVPVIDIAESLG